MAMYHRVGFTAAQSAELWERWKKGEGLKSIGRAFGKPSSCIFAHLRPSGGIMAAARRRSRLALTMAEREEISRGIVEGQSVRAIARMLARAASTVSREINRNGGIGRYRAAAADKLAWKQALRPKPCKLAMHGPLQQAVVGKLELNWSPEQIADVLMRGDPSAICEGFVHDPDVSPIRCFDDELGCFPLREITQHGFAIAFNITGETSRLSTMRDQVDEAAPGLHHVLAQAIHVEIAPVANDDALSG